MIGGRAIGYALVALRHCLPEYGIHTCLVFRATALQPFDNVRIYTDVYRLFYGLMVRHGSEMRGLEFFHLFLC
jgi:hypothetical protein